jgi:hypothetical protein
MLPTSQQISDSRPRVAGRPLTVLAVSLRRSFDETSWLPAFYGNFPIWSTHFFDGSTGRLPLTSVYEEKFAWICTFFTDAAPTVTWRLQSKHLQGRNLVQNARPLRGESRSGEVALKKIPCFSWPQGVRIIDKFVAVFILKALKAIASVNVVVPFRVLVSFDLHTAVWRNAVLSRPYLFAVCAIAALTFVFVYVPTTTNAAPWTPAEIATQLWLDAADASTVTESSGKISQWNDKSGNDRHATAGVGIEPDYVAGSQNGENIIRFDGSTQYFDLGTGLDFLAGTSHVAFAVLNNDNYANLYGAASGNSGSNSLHVGFRNSTNYRINFWANDSYPAISGNYNAGQYNFIRWTWAQGAAKTVYANAKSEGTNGANAGTIGTMAGGGRIANVVGQGYLDADLGELVILTGSPDQDTIDKMEGYLAWKWGLQANLPTGHTYELEAPQVPEPSTLCLATCGLLGLVGCRRRRKR